MVHYLLPSGSSHKFNSIMFRSGNPLASSVCTTSHKLNIMGKSKGSGENSKKAAGNAKKAEAAARKQADVDAKQAAVEDEYWSEGAKGKNNKKELAAKKAQEAKAAKAARDAELEAETSAAAKKKPVLNQKKSTKGSGIDAALDASSSSGGSSRASDLYAHNIDDAISALEISSGKNSDKIDRHPERRFKPALRAYEERRLPEIREEHPGLRLNQYQQRIYEEFQKSPENPFNQVKAAYNASKQDIAATRDQVKAGKEERLKH